MAPIRTARTITDPMAPGSIREKMLSLRGMKVALGLASGSPKSFTTRLAVMLAGEAAALIPCATVKFASAQNLAKAQSGSMPR